MAEADGFWVLYKRYQVFQIALWGANLLIHILSKVMMYCIKRKKCCEICACANQISAYSRLQMEPLMWNATDQ